MALSAQAFVKSWILLLFLTTSGLCFPQYSSTLRGLVTDENGAPFPDVNIFLSTSQNGTVTNKDGAFSLHFPGKDDILNASFIGYETQTIKVNKNASFVKIQLKPSPLLLNEVVITNLSAAALLKKTIGKIPKNYPQVPFLMSQFYRAKLSKSGTLVYLEETAFNIVKSYRSGFDDTYFLVKNRNFYLNDSLGWGLQQIGNADLVKRAHRIFTNAFFRNNKVTYLPNTEFDGRTLHVLSVSPSAEKGTNGKIYIDADDLAFVRFDLTGASGDIVKVQYKKIDGKYYLMSGHSMHLNKHLSHRDPAPAEADMITTNINLSFNKNEVEGTPVSAEDFMRTYATHDTDTLFWQQHNSILPDSSILQALEKYYEEKQKESTALHNSTQYAAYIKRLYTPNLSLMASTGLANDFSMFNHNTNSINRYVSHLLQRNLHGTFKQQLGIWLYQSVISIPMEETASEWLLLRKNGINAKINLLLINKYNSPYLYNSHNQTLLDFKTENYLDFMRLHTARNDGHYVKSFLIEEDLAKADLSNRNNLINYLQLYAMELLMHRGTNTYNPFKKDINPRDMSEEKQPLIIDRNRSWVKYLFNPGAEYQRHVLGKDLSDEEQRYLKRSACWSWLNLVSPQMYGIPKFKLNEKDSFAFSLNYLRTPFGEMSGQNFWLMHNHSQLHGVFVKQYRNYEKTTFGIGYKLYDVGLFQNVYSTTSFDIWQQPTDFKFKTNQSFTGFHFGQIFEYQFFPHKYINQNNLSLFLGFDYKTEGYMPESFFMEKNFNVKAGIKVNLR